jgi:hypothetical protein
MTGWKAKRFWKDATVVQDASGWHVLLDGRPVRTPAKAAMDLPTEEMASAIAGEWAAQGRKSTPCPCRSPDPPIRRSTGWRRSIARWRTCWPPMPKPISCVTAPTGRSACATSRPRHGTRFSTGPRAVSAPGSCRPRASCHQCSRNPRCAACPNRARGGCIPAHRAARPRQPVGLPVLGLAVAHGRLDPPEGWRLSRIDEDWQIAQWGEDEEAAEVAARKLGEFLHAKRFWTLSTAL